jgi:hypothetical protein
MLGLGELVAETVDEYVAIAARTAGKLAWLAEQRATLRERLLSSPISDAPTYTRAVETAYRTMWHHWCTETLTPLAGRGDLTPLAPLSGAERGGHTKNLPLSAPERGLGGEVSL